MDGVSCRVCSHGSRVEIEAAVGETGADLFEVAARFGVTRAALVKHARCAPRAAQEATDSPTAPDRPAPRRAGRRAPTTAIPAPPKVAILEDEEPPATSRSEEISARPPATPKTAREKVEKLVDSLQKLVDDVSIEGRSGEPIPLGAKLAVLRAMVPTLRLLGTFTGEIGASESTVASSPFYKRVRAAVVEALRPHPAAARAVAEALDRLERGGPDLEAAAE